MKKTVRFLAVILMISSMQQSAYALERFKERIGGITEKVSAIGQKKLDLPSANDYKKLALIVTDKTNAQDIDDYSKALVKLYNQILIAIQAFAPQFATPFEAIKDAGKNLANNMKEILAKNHSVEKEKNLRLVIKKIDDNWRPLNQQSTNSQQQEILRSIEKFKNQLKTNAGQLIIFVEQKRKAREQKEDNDRLAEIEKNNSQLTTKILAINRADEPAQVSAINTIQSEAKKVRNILTKIKGGRKLSIQSGEYRQLKESRDTLNDLKESLNTLRQTDRGNSLKQYIGKLMDNIEDIQQFYFIKI